MSTLSTHVLDTSRGRPAAGIPVRLEGAGADGIWGVLGEGLTNEDGRVANLLDSTGGGHRLAAGVYRLTFETAAYFAARHEATFYPEVIVTFTLASPDEHYHVPVLLSPFGYSTYRGS